MAIFSTQTSSPSMSLFPRLSKAELMHGFILPTISAVSLCGAMQWYKFNHMKPIIPDINPAEPTAYNKHKSSLKFIKNNPTMLVTIAIIAGLAYQSYKKHSPEQTKAQD